MVEMLRKCEMKSIFIGGTDKIEKYIEVAEPAATVEEA